MNTPRKQNASDYQIRVIRTRFYGYGYCEVWR